MAVLLRSSTDFTIENEDLIPIDVKYPNFIIDGNTATLGERTYIFDSEGSVISITNNEGFIEYNDQSESFESESFGSESFESFGSERYSSKENFDLPSAQQIVDAIVNAVVGPLESILNDMVSGVKNFFSEQLANIISKFNSIIEYYNELKQKIQDAINDILNYITRLYTNAKNKIISAYEFVVEGVKYIFNTLKFRIKWIWRYTIEKVDQIITTAKEYVNKTMKYFHYGLYVLVIFIIIVVILAIIFRFAPIDLRVKFIKN